MTICRIRDFLKRKIVCGKFFLEEWIGREGCKIPCLRSETWGTPAGGTEN